MDTGDTLAAADARIAAARVARMSLRRLLIAGSLATFACAIVFAFVPHYWSLSLMLLGASIALLAVLVLSSWLPEWASVLMVGLLAALILLLRPAETGDVAASTFFVGVLFLGIVAILPSWRYVAVAAMGAVAVYAAIALVTTAAATEAPGAGVSWQMVLFEAGIVLTITVLDLWLLLRSVSTVTDAEEKVRQEVVELIAVTAGNIEQLERVVAERTAHLEAAVARRDELAHELREASLSDPHTGLANQRRWEAEFPQLVSECGRSGQSLAVAVIDLDHFSDVNNHFGHQAGDEVIRIVADCLLDSAAGGDLVSRIGGEEFAIAMPGIDEKGARERCARIQQTLARAGWGAVTPGHETTCSIGFEVLPPSAGTEPERSARDALGAADAGMLRAKRQGRNRIEGPLGT